MNLDDYYYVCQDCLQVVDEYGHCHVCGEPVTDTAQNEQTNPSESLFDKEND